MLHTDAVRMVLPEGGEMGVLMRTYDWSKTPLGSVETWPQSLRSAVSILLPSSAPIVLFWGKELTTLYNDSYINVLADKHPHVLGTPAWECWSEIWDDVLGPLLKDVVNSGNAIWGQDYPFFMNRSGFREETYFDISYNPVRDESGAVGGVFCIVSETTGRVYGERRLRTLSSVGSRTAEAKTVNEAVQLANTALAENPADIPFAITYLVDKDQTAGNLCASFGLPEMSTFLPPHIQMDNSTAVWPLGQVMQDEAVLMIEGLAPGLAAVLDKPDYTVPNKAIIMPLWSASQMVGFLVVGVSPFIALPGAYRDFFDLVAANISSALDNARAYEIERQRAETLAEIDRAKTAFFNNVSHEFRTPLTLILSPLEELLDTDDLTSFQRTTLTMAHRNSLRLLKLVNTLLDFSRIEADRADASYRPVDLSAMTTDLASMFRSAVEKAGLRLIVDCPPLPGESVYIDVDMWEKIVMNLLSNAFKHTFEGEIVVKLRPIDHSVQLIVRDTGIGIPEEEQANIFERFHRVRSARARTHEGTGIGLALVHELTRLHGGEVTVESQVDVGTTFTVTIPRGKNHLPPERIGAERSLESTAVGAIPYVEEALRWLADARKTETSEIAASIDPIAPVYVPPRRFAPENARIIVVDDNADMRDYLTRLLAVYWNVDAYADGQLAFDAMRSSYPAPDLLLSDVMMPVMDGFGLIHAIRGEDALKTMSIILLSARAGEEAAIEGLAAGADDYLVKPFSARELLARINAQLELSALRRQTEAEQRRMLNVYTSIGEGFIAVDHEFRYIYINPKAEELIAKFLGKSASDIMGKTMWEVMPGLEESEFGKEYKRVMREQTPAQITSYLAPVDGWFDARAYPNPDGMSLYFQDITEQIKAEEREREQIAKIAAAEERQRLARDLHDAVNQTLFTANMLAQSLPRLFERTPEKVAPHLQKLSELNQGAMAEMRTLLIELMPSAMERSQLSDLVRQLVDIVRGRTTLDVSLDIKNTRSEPLPQDVQVSLYRIAQESLNNVVKHAKARRVEVSLRCESALVAVRIADDGRGFDLTRTAAGIGLDNIQERAKSIDAELSLRSTPGAGTEIIVEWNQP